MPNQFGSFGSALGGSDAIRAALSRRQGGGSVSPLSQLSGSAPGASVIPSTPPTNVPNMPGLQTPNTNQLANNTGNGEALAIIRALAERLKRLP